MRVVQVIVARPAWYDRNPVVRMNFNAAQGVAPHVLTTRWTYTVPTAKKFQAQNLQCALWRITAAAPAAKANVLLGYLPNGGAQAYLAVASVFSNGISDKDNVCVGSALTMLAGDVATGLDQDTSTVGTMELIVSLQGIEFDA